MSAETGQVPLGSQGKSAFNPVTVTAQDKAIPFGSFTKVIGRFCGF